MRHILFDGLNLALPQGTGIATYARATVAAAQANGFNASILFASNNEPPDHELLRTVHFVESIVAPQSPRRSKLDWMFQLLRDSRGVPATPVVKHHNVCLSEVGHALPGDDPDILHCRDIYRRATVFFRRTGKFLCLNSLKGHGIAHWTYPMPLKLNSAANIVTIHDLVPLILPQATLDNKQFFFNLCHAVAANADKIVTVSEKSRSDIIQILKVEPSRVVNFYQAVDGGADFSFEPFDASAQFIETLLGWEARKYYLFFGAMEPKKNIDRLIQAYLLSRSPTPLLIVGGVGWGKTNAMDYLPSKVFQGSGNSVHRLGYLPRFILARLVRCAKATLFPSLYEGFGLPLVESMVLRVPTLSSITGSLPEISGGHTVSVDPYSVEDIANGISRLDDDHESIADMAKQGQEFVERYSSTVYASKMGAFYNSL